MTRSFDAYLFDLDGTLIDSETIWIESIGTALRQRGVAISDAEATQLVLGRSWPNIFEDIQERYPGAYASREAMEEITVPFYHEWLATRDVRIHTSVDLLRKLAKQAPVAIVSGSTRNRIAESIVLMEVESLIALYIGAEDYAAGKPDPSCFLLAARQLGVAPDRCLVFEDSPAGVAAAKSAGMTCVALQREGGPAPAGADLALTDLSDFSDASLPVAD